ncbi:MAG: hypothetical protein AB7F25_06825 [Deferribacterales bacterium]
MGIIWRKPTGTDTGNKNCLITVLHGDGKTKSIDHANPRTMLEFYRTRIIAQADYPEHFLDNSKGWSSSYIGDEEPCGDDQYIVSYIRTSTGRKPLCGGVVLAKYSTHRATFNVGDKYEVIAWMRAPKPSLKVNE